VIPKTLSCLQPEIENASNYRVRIELEKQKTTGVPNLMSGPGRKKAEDFEGNGLDDFGDSTYDTDITVGLWTTADKFCRATSRACNFDQRNP